MITLSDRYTFDWGAYKDVAYVNVPATVWTAAHLEQQRSNDLAVEAGSIFPVPP
jgi:hypothetical protein